MTTRKILLSTAYIGLVLGAARSVGVGGGGFAATVLGAAIAALIVLLALYVTVAGPVARMLDRVDGLQAIPCAVARLAIAVSLAVIAAAVTAAIFVAIVAVAQGATP